MAILIPGKAIALEANSNKQRSCVKALLVRLELVLSYPVATLTSHTQLLQPDPRMYFCIGLDTIGSSGNTPPDILPFFNTALRSQRFPRFFTSSAS